LNGNFLTRFHPFLDPGSWGPLVRQNM
jgi:hypothetical protein